MLRQEIALIKGSELHLHMDYDFLTIGELGNIQIRLQAALRTMAGFTPGVYPKPPAPSPHFVVSSISTKHSVDIRTVMAVIGMAMSTPGAIESWRRTAPEVYRRFRIAIVGIIRGVPELADDAANASSFEGFEVRVTKGETSFRADRQFLRELGPKEKRALRAFISSLMGTTNKVNIGDQESEIEIQMPENPGEPNRRRQRRKTR